MAPINKKKSKKSSNKEKKIKEEVVTTGESVISGQLQKKIDKKHQAKKDPRGVVFIKHLPHGFFEEQLKKYFEQFGNVTRVRLARSKRTGNSKGYAFVEFEYPEVAEVAAETMDNYLMFKKIVKAEYIPPEKQQYNYFRTNVKQIKNKSGKTVWVSKKTASIQQKAKKYNDWSDEKFQERTTNQMEKVRKMCKKFAHLGIDIKKFIVPAEVVTKQEQKAQDKIKTNKTKVEKSAGGSKNLKRKVESEEKALVKNNINKKSKKNITLEDLLGNTIQEDSDDEDYIEMPDSDEANEDSSDEETYGFTKGYDDMDEEEMDDDSENEEEKSKVSVNIKKTKKTSFGKTLKSSNSERFDQITKRKPHTGGIQKLNKKTSKQGKVVTKDKGALQLAVAKELAKPLAKVKGKLAKSIKPSKVSKVK